LTHREWRTESFSALQGKANDKSKSQGDEEAGQRTPGGVATRDPEASPGEASP